MSSPGRDLRGVLSSPRLLLILLAIFILQSGCGLQRLERRTVLPDLAGTLDRRSAYLKAHMKDGGVYVLSNWQVAPKTNQVTGEGQRLDANREILAEGAFSVPLDSVALFESNILTTAPEISGLTVLTGLSLALTAYCLANPKACFGSCPTFYVAGEDGPALRAEGFSSSVAPSLEATDLDALYRTRPAGSRVRLDMRNEALETHVVRQADILAVPCPPPGRVASFPGGTFRGTSGFSAPLRAAAPEGDVTAALGAFDGAERRSPSDSTDLAAREEITLAFDAPAGDSLCVVIAARQSLLSTYVFYQSLAWMGTDAAAWLARLERGDGRLRSASRAAADRLGGIDVLVPDAAGSWRRVGSFQETGPLATDVKALPLPPGSGETIRLRLAKGHWRLDWIALARRGPLLEPVRVPPARVSLNGTRDPAARRALLDPALVLVTFPGDAVTLEYDLPKAGGEYELFLESRGYYLEWIRKEWMAEESPWQAARLFLDPDGALRALAPAYKGAEAGLEDVFWNSRFARPAAGGGEVAP